MKKLLSLLLTAVMLCSMLAVLTVPAFAEEAKSWTENGEYYHVVKNGEELKQLMENCAAGNTPVHILLCSQSVKVDSIRISSTNHFIFEKYGIYKYALISSNDDNAPLFVIEETAPNTVLDFSRHDIDLLSRNDDGDGGCIYVNAENFTIIGSAIGYSSVSGDGAGIYVNDTGCTIKDVKFRMCEAYDGGAIYSNAESCKISGCNFDYCKSRHDGGAVYFDESLCSIEGSKFTGCKTEVDGGAVCVSGNNVTIESCEFKECSAGDDGGAIYMCYGNYYLKVDGCYFYSCSCEDEGPAVDGFASDCTMVYSCKSDKEGCFENCQCVQCTVITEPEKPTEYTRPYMTNYAYLTTQGKDDCDVIRPDIKNVTESENKLFTIEGQNAYGAFWTAIYNAPLTITAKDGYLIARIEAVVRDDDYYENLLIDNGTKAKSLIDNPHYHGDPIAKDYIAKFDDIYDKSVTFTTNGDITNWRTVYFSDFIVYYVKDTPENRRTKAPEVSPEYTRDGETYDRFTFDMDKASYYEPYIATSELKGFTLTDTVVFTRGHIYGWATNITITAPEGYTITRIEGKPVHMEGNVEFLKSNAGKIENQGKPLAKDGIVRINDINAGSVEISCTSDYVEFGEFLVFYEENATLASVFSGGTLWLIIGVAAVAATSAVVIVVVKKKKPVTVNGAAEEKSDEEAEE